MLVINWEDIPSRIAVPDIRRPIRSDKPYTLTEQTLTVSLLPHESFVARYL
jgi:hypothetical protein